MILTLLMLAFALLTAAVLLTVARGQARPVASGDDLLLALKPVDIEAFRNLTEPTQEEYLRERLPRREFRSLQRARVLAAAEYVRCIAHNAAVLLRVGEGARQSTDTEIARAAQELASVAIQLRINSLLALVILYIRYFAPEARIGTRRLGAYERMRENTLAFTMLHMPGFASRIEAAL